MKLLKQAYFIICLLFLHWNIQQAETCNPSSFLISGQIQPKHQKLIDTFGPSYPVVATVQQSDGTLRAQQYIKNRSLAHTVTPKVKDTLQHGQFTTLKGHPNDYQNYPKGITLFPNYPSLATKFDTLISLLRTQPKVKAFFNKIHLNILNELYTHLMNIYTNFNLQHVGIREVTTPQGTALKFSIPTFLQNENQFEMNKKTLIINHFVNIIESQFNGKIKSIMPNIPHLFATSAGKTLIQNDYSIDLTHFMLQQLEPAMAEYKKQYLQALVTYLDFFKEFSTYLLKPHPNNDTSLSAFVDIAEQINNFLYSTESVGQDLSTTLQAKNISEKMKPGMFTFGYDDIRALKIIPHIARSLPTNTQTVTWPQHIVEAANKGIYIEDGSTCYPLAYFTDANGDVVSEEQAEHLYIVLKSGKNYFQEELLAQPTWLNNWDGIVKILQACFGDFTAIVGMGILDPCMEMLIKNGIDTMNGKDPNSDNSITLACTKLIDSFKKNNIAKVPALPQNNNMDNINNLLPQQSTLTPTNIPTLNPASSDIASQNNQTSSTVNNNLIPTSNDISAPLNQ